MSSDAIIRSATDADLATITEIYAHYVRNTTSTFEIDPPDVAEIARRRADIRERRLPHLVAEVKGAVVGYAYAVPYRPRLAYRFTVEDSIYIDAAHTGHAAVEWLRVGGARRAPARHRARSRLGAVASLRRAARAAPRERDGVPFRQRPRRS